MGTERFHKLLPVILKHEGGLTDDAADPGGITKYGISFRYLKNKGEAGDIDGDGDVDRDDIIAMTREKAAQFYLNDFYLPVHGDYYENDRLALHLFDHAVNAGVRSAVKILQRIVGTAQDGIIGMQTLREVDIRHDEHLWERYSEERVRYYNMLCDRNPALKKFIRGWVNRVNDCNTITI